MYYTSEYWVAKDYHHVYYKYTGKIENYIEENETCEIKGDEIIVTAKKYPAYNVGRAITVIFGIFAVVLFLENTGILSNLLTK